MQNFTVVADTVQLKDSLTPLMENDESVQSCFEGTTFPTVNVRVGMQCYRSDQSKTYRLTSTGPNVWVMTEDIANPRSVAMGGTGAATFSSGGLLVGNGTSPVGIASAAQIVAAIGATAVANATTAETATVAATASALDSAALNAANTWAAKQTFAATTKVQQSLEKETITAAAPSATQAFDFLTQAIQWFTTNPTANWTLNVRGDGSNSLNSLMAVGECATLTVKSTMGATPYYASGFQIDGGAVTPKWIGGTAPTSGDASCINIYTYSITKTATATFTVIASKAKTS